MYNTAKTNEAFPVPLDVREIGNGKWELLSDYKYKDTLKGDIIVPKGFITDLYSIPWILRSIVSKVQDSNGPAVVHDWLYQSQTFGPKGQRVADKVLKRAMTVHWAPISKYKRFEILTGLKLGGWTGYRATRKAYNQICKDLRTLKPTVSELINGISDKSK